MRDEAEAVPEEAQRGWRDRIVLLSNAAGALLRTRLAILREEIALKAAFAAKAFVAVVVAVAAGAGALLLFAALLAAIFASLLKSVVLGILAAFVLYGLIAVAAAALGWKALTRVKPLELRATEEELRRDWEAVRAATAPPPPVVVAGSAPETFEEDSGLEERFRAGAE
jgi:Putative Actinobacterial Holin-X, holin superfamily III